MIPERVQTAMAILTAACNDDFLSVKLLIDALDEMAKVEDVVLTLVGWLDALLAICGDRLDVQRDALLQGIALDYAREGSG